MVSLYHSPQIEALSLSQESGKISIKFLALKSIYLLHFTRKLMDKITNQEMEKHLRTFVNYQQDD